jgi:hypothetical protein
MERARVLADTSLWIDHIAGKQTPIADLLKIRRIALHPLIIGELSMGSLKNRSFFIRELKELPSVDAHSHTEVMAFVEWNELFGTGIGFVDAHLLASVKTTDKLTLATKDRRLAKQAKRLGVAYTPA